jgi:hypothetical protein
VPGMATKRCPSFTRWLWYEISVISRSMAPLVSITSKERISRASCTIASLPGRGESEEDLASLFEGIPGIRSLRD